MKYYIRINKNSKEIVAKRLEDLGLNTRAMLGVNNQWNIVTFDTSFPKQHVIMSITDVYNSQLTTLDTLFLEEFGDKIQKEINQNRSIHFSVESAKYKIMSEDVFKNDIFICSLKLCRAAIEAFDKK